MGQLVTNSDLSNDNGLKNIYLYGASFHWISNVSLQVYAGVTCKQEDFSIIWCALQMQIYSILKTNKATDIYFLRIVKTQWY